MPPSIMTVVLFMPCGMNVSGMMTLSGMSVVTSSSIPPAGAGRSILKVIVVFS